MPLYESNIQESLSRIQAKMKKIRNPEKLTREIALNLQESNITRIHVDGKDVSGANITYKKARKTPTVGAYSRSYAKKRRKANRTAVRVDFEFTGDLRKALIAEAIPGGWGVGFSGARKKQPPTNAQLKEMLEEKFGHVWGITKQDELFVNKLIKRHIKDSLA